MKSLIKVALVAVATLLMSCAPVYAQRSHNGGGHVGGHSTHVGNHQTYRQPARQGRTTVRGNNGRVDQHGRVDRSAYRGHIDYDRFYSTVGSDHHFVFANRGFYGAYPCFWFGGFQFWYGNWPGAWGYYDQFYIIYGVDAYGNPVYYMYDVNFPDAAPLVVNVVI